MRKRFLALALAVLAVLPTAWAYDFSATSPSGHTLYYEIISGTTNVGVVRPGSGYAYSNYVTGNVVIPDTVTYNGTTYNITELKVVSYYGTFKNCSGLTSITIPNSVTSIGEYAFSGCSGLTSVTIPNSVTSIGNSAFEYCSSLTSVTIPNSVTSIGNSAFAYCSGLTSVTIPNSVTSIGESAFSYCSDLTSATIPNSVTSIGEYAFAYCTGLTSITIPNSVTSIGNYAFSGCSGLTTLNFNAINCSDFISYYHPFTFCSIPTITIGDSVQRIPGYFAYFAYDNTSLTSVTIGNSVTSIGDYAFGNCISLTSVTIPNSVISIGVYAFGNCISLTSVTIPDSVTSIGNNAFYLVNNITYSGTATGSPWGALSLNGYVDGDFIYSDSTKTTLTRYIGSATNVTIPNSVTSIENSAFSNYSGLTSITIPNSVTSIGEYAFSGCSGLTTLNFNAINCSDFNSSNYPFNSCPISTIIIGDSVQRIPAYFAYYKTALSSITIPNSVTSIGNNAFSYCSGLTSVTIGNSVTSIGNNAFYNCTSLTSVTIGNSVTSIGNNAFYNCTSLTSITIPNLVTSIEECTFYNCISLNSATIPNSVTSIGEAAFANCKDLTSITIPDSVTSIGTYAFNACSNLTSVTIGNSVTSIGEGTFANCSDLTSVTIPNSVTSIGEGAFYFCSSLTSVTIGNSVTSIGVDAFSDCTSLTSVTIGSSVTSIGKWAFWQCSSLNIIICKSAFPPTLGSSVWANVPTNANVYVPCGRSSIYSANTGWSRFTNIQDSSFINVELSVNDSLMGHAEVLLNSCDSTIIKATPNSGYVFLNWSDGNTNNPRTIVLNRDTTFTAYFIPQYRVEVLSDNDTMGTVSGGGSFDPDSEITISAHPLDGYKFIGWNDGNTDNPRIIVVNSDTTFTASFAPLLQYTITVSSEDESMGLATGGGVFDEQTIISIVAAARGGYRFKEWSDGDTNKVRDIMVVCDSVLIAKFERNVGIANIDNLEDLDLYPNPTTGIITFNRTDIQKVEVLDAMGRLLMTIENKHIIDLSKLSQGYYTLRITLPEGVAIRKVIRK